MVNAHRHVRDGRTRGRDQKLNFHLIINENGEEVILETIDAFTIEEVKEIAFRNYGKYYSVDQIKIELAPPEEFDYEVYWAMDDDYVGSPTIEQERNAKYDLDAMERISKSPEKKKISKCHDCGKEIEYNTKPFKRCSECKRKFERERVRRARLNK